MKSMIGVRSGVSLSLALGAAALLGGCAWEANGADDLGGGATTDVGSDGPTAEAIGEISQALDSNWASGPYSWSQGQAAVPLRSVNTHHCVLTRAAGDFEGGGERVRVYTSGTTWYLGGQSQQEGVSGKAYCFNKNAFLANGSGRWSSDELWISASSNYSAGGWWGDAATMISGIGGRLENGAGMYVAQSSGAFTPSRLHVVSDGDPVRAFAHALLVGTQSSGRLVKFWGSEWSVSSRESSCSLNGRGDNEVQMAPVNDAMCYFSSVGVGDRGDFNGGGESVEIYPKVSSNNIEYWYLRAKSYYCDYHGDIQASARCMRRDQR
ncbi:MAG TPA: hypothetical protein VIM73_06815 [Polyangiaceae bacterium]